jgi:hypothetical protein
LIALSRYHTFLQENTTQCTADLKGQECIKMLTLKLMGSSEIAAIIDSSPSNTSAGPGEQ